MRVEYIDELASLMKGYNLIQDDIKKCTDILTVCTSSYRKPLDPTPISDIRLRFGKNNWIALREKLAVIMQHRLKELHERLEFSKRTIVNLKVEDFE